MSFTSKLVSAFDSIGKFIAVLFNEGLHQELSIVLPLAAKAVKQIAADPSIIESGAKRDAAVASILAELASKQVAIGLSVVNLAIEMAVQHSRQEQQQ